MIKILYVLNDLNNGGTESFVMNHYRTLDRSKFQADFLILSGKNLYYKDEISDKGDTVYHISKDNKKEYFKNIFRVKNFLDNHSYDVVHINSCSLKFMAQVAYAASKVKNKPKVIGHAHSIGEPENTLKYKIGTKLLKEVIEKNIDFAMSCSTDVAEMKFSKNRIESCNYKMIPNAIETSKFMFSEDSRYAIRKKYELDNGIVIGIVGRLEKWKNQSFLLDVLKKVREKDNAYLLMVGDGDIRDDLEQKAIALGVKDYAIFAGQVNNAFEFYSAMDVFCLPSFSEGFPFVLVEAQANGLKCLASTDITEETNISGTMSYLDRFNVDLWSEKIVSNGNRRLNNSEINKVIDIYDIKNATRNLEDIYMNLVNL